MFCASCRRERGVSRYCILCGAALERRANPLIETDLDRVRWLLDEVACWDESLASTGVRAAISEFYARQEQVLVEDWTF